MNADAFRHFYDYHFAENRKIWDEYVSLLAYEQFIQTVNYSHGAVRGQIVHMINADEMWFSQLQGVAIAEPPAPPDFDDRKIIRAHWDEVEKSMRAYLAGLQDEMLFEKPFAVGEDKDLILWQVLLHVANHGTDHRAQLLRLLNDLGVKTTSQDYIFYVYDHPYIMLTIDIDTARRFILGKQGLWPGRRWRGIEGTEQAMRAMEYLQLDPLQIIARSQDITAQPRARLHAWHVGRCAYQQRKFFDWGGWLAVRPMDELPYWRVVMRRERDGGPELDPRIRKMAHEHADAIAEMRAILRERGTVSNRDFEMATRTRTQSYRGRKDSALALYYLWRTGEVMTHHRENFERVYALTEKVAPAHLIHESDEAEADRFLIKKEISFSGLSRLSRTR
jgi:uncharacterized damage-inducible protein DinB